MVNGQNGSSQMWHVVHVHFSSNVLKQQQRVHRVHHLVISVHLSVIILKIYCV